MSPHEPAAVLSADPAWEHDDALGRRGARAKYSTMSTKEICALPLPQLAERCALGLWKLANMAQDALDVATAWGFLPVAEVVWTKLRPCVTCCATGSVNVHVFGETRVLVPGADRLCPTCHGHRGEHFVESEIVLPTWMGLGTTVRNVHEIMLLCRPLRGRAPERLSAGVRSAFAAPMLADIDGVLGMTNEAGDILRGASALVHSAKPDEAYQLLERLYPGPYVEMFGRRTRPGWRLEHSDQDDKLDEAVRIFRDVWPARTREERLAKARRSVR